MADLTLNSDIYNILEEIEEIDEMREFYHNILSRLDSLVLDIEKQLLILRRKSPKKCLWKRKDEFKFKWYHLDKNYKPLDNYTYDFD